MPVQLPTTFGKTDYSVTTALRRLAAAVDALEGQSSIPSGWDAAIRGIRADLTELTRRVDVLNRQVNP